MAPLPISRAPSGGVLQLRQISDSISALRPRDLTPSASLLEHVNSQPNLVSRSAETLHTLSKPLKKAATLMKRQQILAIPTTYQGLNSGPAPGTVAGIVLGTVGGFILVLWLIYTCFNMGGRGAIVDEEVVEVHHHSRSPRRSHSSRRSEVIEVERSRTPPRSRRETIVVEETRRTAPIEREDDIVEVIEEHSPPRRPKSKRTSGFRTVDPAEFGGGDRPRRSIRR